MTDDLQQEHDQLLALRNSNDFLDLPKRERDAIDRRLDELGVPRAEEP